MLPYGRDGRSLRNAHQLQVKTSFDSERNAFISAIVVEFFAIRRNYGRFCERELNVYGMCRSNK
jgi:hypothetical protein